jgi:hypothetical protein
MCTPMSEEDWEHMIMFFRACLPRRGRNGVDDRVVELLYGQERPVAGFAGSIWALE